MMIVPQKPYMPLGTLSESLRYPDVSTEFPDAEMKRVLALVGLPQFSGRLGERARWDQQLSTGERQRLAIARAVLHAPEVLILDDAISSLDAVSQAALLKQVRAALPKAALVSLGQTLPPNGLHDQVLRLTRRGTTAAIHIRDQDRTEKVE
jgi:putative ATP-binding cassette transporter